MIVFLSIGFILFGPVVRTLLWAAFRLHEADNIKAINNRKHPSIPPQLID